MKLKMFNLLFLFLTISLVGISKQTSHCHKTACIAETIFNNNGGAATESSEITQPVTPKNFLFIY
ncbi:MAG TPA: hypothetical protein PKC39_12840 [Ferruginibacter sp.]|nr:hypothetical protein [Ferruginibacter sp.]HMP21839.1 hypothetical protein [Ferruginibacter sp.]